MSHNPNLQVPKIKQALAEIRSNREHFSDAAFSQIVMLMLDKLRQLQTIAPIEANTADEIRLVTVMFIDVKDSTEIVQQLDASDWKMVIDTAHEQIAEIVAKWDGQIGQYLGDGVLCFFGAQRSKGDDAPHAVSCALQIQTAINTYADNVRQLHGIDFNIRIGISTGRVVVGMIGSQTIKQELLALGPATNLAARLQGVAPVGGVLVDSTTYNRIRRDYITQAQLPIELRGFDKPVNNYLVLARRTQPATQFTDTHIAGIELPLVGRDDDLALISYVCDRALQNQVCEVINVTADVGMGKSRLLQETVHLTEGHFNHVIMTANYEMRTRPYNLLWDMLTTQCHLTDAMSDEMILQQIEAYIGDMWDDQNAPHVARSMAQLAGFTVSPPIDNAVKWVVRWFQGIAQSEPLVITIDNLQWADQDSTMLLEQLAQHLEDQCCVIICAGRTEYRSLKPTFMAGYPYVTWLELDTLSSDATFSIIRSVFSQIERVPSTLAYSINERVEGNPLFVHEYIGMLFDNNVFKRTTEGNWRFNIIMLDVALNTLPNGLLGILQARLDDLPDQARSVMQLGAISGQQFWESSILALANIDNISSWIEHLITRGMVVKDEQSIFPDQTQYHFRHSLYHDVAYKMIPRTKREAYHQQMSSWLLERIAGKVDYYPMLADQFASSGEYLASLYSYLEAVEMQIHDKQELKALSFIDKALSLTNKIDRTDALAIAAKLWAHRGEALVTLERYDEASAASQSSLMLLDELPRDQHIDSRITAERILGLAHMSLGRYTDAYDALTRAHNLLPQSASAQIAMVLQTLGEMYYRQGRLDDSLAYLKRASIMATNTQDLVLIARARTTLGMVDLEKGQFVPALEFFDEALQIYRSLRFVQEQASTLTQIGLVHLMMLNYGKAYEYFSDADYLNTSEDYVNVLVQGYRAFALIMLGRITQGKALLSDAMKQIPGDVDMNHRLHLTHIASAIITGDYIQAHLQALDLTQQEGINPIIRARAQLLLGLAAHHLGNTDAVDHLQAALRDEEAFGGRDQWLCHAIMAYVTEDDHHKQTHYHKAIELISDRSQAMAKMPEMCESFLGNRYVKAVFERAGVDELPII